MKIKFQAGQNIWFTSDTHYNHKNICKDVSEWKSGQFRDFSTIKEMNDTIVRNINDYVAYDDILFHLGDWSFGGFDSIQEFRDRVVCNNIHLITGNHDHHIEKNKNGIQSLFSSVQKYMELTISISTGDNTKNIKYNFVLFHHPILSWSELGNGWMHLFGHMHLSPEYRIQNGRAMDVGIDGNNLKPNNLFDVVSLLQHQPKVHISMVNDHHEKS